MLVKQIHDGLNDKREKDHTVVLSSKTRCRLEVVDDAPYYTLVGIDDAFSIHLEVFWRAIAGSRVVFASTDDDQKFGVKTPFNVIDAFEQHFSGKYIESVQIKQTPSDIVFHFENASRIEVFVSSCGYEGWSLGGDGISLVCLGGGEVGVF